MATNTPTTANVFKANKEHKKRGCSKPFFNLFKCLGKRGNELPIGKDTDKIEQLKTYVQQSKYIDVLEQPIICASFGLPYLVNIFRNEYRERFYNYLKEYTTTVATVFKATGIPHKYLCEVKAYYEKKGLLKVVCLDRCPSTGSVNVQYVSTNPKVWVNTHLLPNSNQTKLF